MDAFRATIDPRDSVVSPIPRQLSTGATIEHRHKQATNILRVVSVDPATTLVNEWKLLIATLVAISTTCSFPNNSKTPGRLAGWSPNWLDERLPPSDIHIPTEIERPWLVHLKSRLMPHDKHAHVVRSPWILALNP